MSTGEDGRSAGAGDALGVRRRLFDRVQERRPHLVVGRGVGTAPDRGNAPQIFRTFRQTFRVHTRDDLKPSRFPFLPVDLNGRYVTVMFQDEGLQPVGLKKAIKAQFMRLINYMHISEHIY